MDEQRMQAYLGLIEQLLGCAQEEETALLQANAGLVDAGLLDVMEKYTAGLETQGNSNAGRLRQFVTQLAQWLEENNPSSSAFRHAVALALKIMDLVWLTNGDETQVYTFFRANVGQLDEILMQALPDLFTILIQKHEPSLIAAIFAKFGNLILQFPSGSRMLNVEISIVAYEQVLQVYTREAFLSDWAGNQNNLANAYLYRVRGDRSDNLEQAIRLYQQVQQFFTRDEFPQDWAMTLNNLGLAYKDLIQGKHNDNIENAITAYKQALEVYTHEAFPEEWATTQNNLANAYVAHSQGKSAENLENAITAYKRALQVRKCDTYDWAITQLNLANAYYKRIQGEVGEVDDNIEDAIAAAELALQVLTRDEFPQYWAMAQNNLANAYKDRAKGKADNIKTAIDAYELALEVFIQFPQECRETARNLGNLHLRENQWEEATSAYTHALNATETLYQSCILLDSKAAELRETADLPRRAAYSYAKIGNLSEAIATLEQGRARGLSESLDRDRTNLDNLKVQNEPLYTQYKDITNQIRNLDAIQHDRMVSSDRHTITPEVLRNEALRLRQELKETIDQIRQQPGYETFLSLPTFEDVQKAVITLDRPLTYLLTTPAGSLALVVTPGDIHPHPIWLNDFTDTQLTELLQTWFAAYNNSSSDHQTWLNTIDQTTQKLWNPLMGPLVEQLQDKGIKHITLIPTGYLSLLPLHAAWTEIFVTLTARYYAADAIHITYAPNAKSLTAAQPIADRVQADSILAIDDPSHGLPNIRTLDNSQQEINCAIESFTDCTVLRHDEATIESVKSGLAEASIVHFSCHGTANFTEPLNSGLLMSDGLLTLKDLLALNLAKDNGIRLAILSACETGLPGLDNIDEVVSLPVGLMQAGVAGVIASLWSVSDLSTMLLLTRFYDLWRQDGLEPAIALHQAQQWMIHTTDGEKADYCGFVLGTANRDKRSYAHPYHWAAFSYLGV
jgi:CHAT domain-containing protein